MPLLDTGVIAAASGPTIHTATTYDGLAKTGVANGDRGEVRTDTADADTATGFFRAYYDADIGRPVWVPAGLWDSVSGYVANVTGKAALLPADDLAAVTARGWDTTTMTDAGTLTKTTGNPAVLDAPGASDRSRLSFTPTTAPGNGFVALKIEWKTGTTSLATYSYGGDGTRYWRMTFSDGTGGYTRLINSGGTDIGQGAIDLSGSEWLFIDQDFSSATALTQINTPAGGQDRKLIAERQDMTVAAVAQIFYYAALAQLEITEIHWLGLA